MKKLLFLSVFMLMANVSFSAPSNTMSNTYSPSAGETISSDSYKDEENAQATTYNAHTHTDISTLGTVTSGTWAGTTIGTSYGGTGNTYGLGLPSGSVFFMISGSCPSGTTDVTATYSNKFVMINATQGTTGDGSGTTESHTLTTSEIPAHTHTAQLYADSAGTQNRFVGGDGGGATGGTGTTASGGGTGGGHTHNMTASNYKPAYVTCKMCQVN